MSAMTQPATTQLYRRRRTYGGHLQLALQRPQHRGSGRPPASGARAPLAPISSLLPGKRRPVWGRNWGKGRRGAIPQPRRYSSRAVSLRCVANPFSPLENLLVEHGTMFTSAITCVADCDNALVWLDEYGSNDDVIHF